MKLGIVIATLGTRPAMLEAAKGSAQAVADQVEVIDDPTMPLAKAQNLGVSRLKTEWVMILDDDNLLIENWAQDLKLLAGTFYRGPVIVAPMERFGAQGGLWGCPMDWRRLEQENHVPCSSLFTYDAWSQVGGFDDVSVDGDQGYPDWRFWLKLSRAGYNFDWYPHPIAKLRIWEGQLSVPRSVAQVEKLKAVARRQE